MFYILCRFALIYFCISFSTYSEDLLLFLFVRPYLLLETARVALEHDEVDIAEQCVDLMKTSVIKVKYQNSYSQTCVGEVFLLSDTLCLKTIGVEVILSLLSKT